MSVMSKLMGLVAEALPEPVAPEGMVLPRPSGKYMRGGRGVTFAGWRPALREEQDDIGGRAAPCLPTQIANGPSNTKGIALPDDIQRELTEKGAALGVRFPA